MNKELLGNSIVQNKDNFADRMARISKTENG